MPRLARTKETGSGYKAVIARSLVTLFTPYPGLDLNLGDRTIYKWFRCIEPSLVSYFDSKEGLSQSGVPILVVDAAGSPAGVVSFLVETNNYRSGRANQFARIDLVIVAPACRGLGIGRLLMFTVIIQLLEIYGRSLYSISCLAAHPAVEKCLEEVGFRGERRSKGRFKHEEIRLDLLDGDELLTSLKSRMNGTLQVTNFRLRQRQ